MGQILGSAQDIADGPPFPKQIKFGYDYRWKGAFRYGQALL